MGQPRTFGTSEFRVGRIVSTEVLDSRGNPKVRVDLYAKNGFGRFSIPSGASRGHLEALGLRDGDKQRYIDQGVRKAPESISTVFGPKINGTRLKGPGENWQTAHLVGRDRRQEQPWSERSSAYLKRWQVRRTLYQVGR